MKFAVSKTEPCPIPGCKFFIGLNLFYHESRSGLPEDSIVAVFYLGKRAFNVSLKFNRKI